jgi:hypothetical protein
MTLTFTPTPQVPTLSASGITLYTTPNGIRGPMAVTVVSLVLALGMKVLQKDRLARGGAEGWEQVGRWGCAERENAGRNGSVVFGVGWHARRRGGGGGGEERGGGILAPRCPTARRAARGQGARARHATSR